MWTMNFSHIHIHIHIHICIYKYTVFFLYNTNRHSFITMHALINQWQLYKYYYDYSLKRNGEIKCVNGNKRKIKWWEKKEWNLLLFKQCCVRTYDYTYIHTIYDYVLIELWLSLSLLLFYVPIQLLPFLLLHKYIIIMIIIIVIPIIVIIDSIVIIVYPIDCSTKKSEKKSQTRHEL